MLLHSDYLAPTFLLTLIFIQIAFIIYFNVISLKTYAENQIITLTGNDPQCEIQNVATLNKNNVCTKNDKYFAQTPINTYTLGKIPVIPSQVCASLCTGSITKTGGCSKSVANYTNCVNDLAPIEGCKQASRPLAKLDVSDTQTVYYYAQNLITGIDDC